MAATLERPASQPANGRQIEQPPPLWGDIPIPIIVGCGEFGQGKTLFGLTICPGPQTLCYDNEGSSLTYRSIDFDHVDMAAELSAKHPSGYTAIDRFLWWKQDALARGKSGGRNGKYRVLMIDPVSEIEDGMADYIRQNIINYGLTTAQVQKSAGLFWGVMKREWKALLDQLRACYETVYAVVHMRDQFVGNAPSGKREPKGKETLFELASLFLEFERVKDAAGNVAAVPSAKIHKSRLARTAFDDGEMKIMPILPPRLPRATPKAIRDYIAKPPDYSHLKKDERAVEKEFSEEERLRLQAQIASDQAMTAQAELSRVEKMSQAAAMQAAVLASAPVAPDLAAGHAQRVAQSAAAATGGPIHPKQIEGIKARFRTAFATQQEAAAWAAPKFQAWGVALLTQLTRVQGEQLDAELCELIASGHQAGIDAAVTVGKAMSAESPGFAKNDAPFDTNSATAVTAPAVTPSPLADAAEHIDGTLKPSEPPAAAVPAPSPPAPIPVTPERLAEIKSLIPQAFSSSEEIVAEMTAAFGKTVKFTDMTCPQADAFISRMRIKAGSRQSAAVPPAATAPAATAPPQAAGHDAPGTITPDQMAQLKMLAEQTGWNHEAMMQFLAPLGLPNCRGLSFNQAAEQINKLAKVRDSFAGGVPGN